MKQVLFSLVLENMAATLAKEITELVQIPTIGIGAGPECNGQVLVLHDFHGADQGQATFCQGLL